MLSDSLCAECLDLAEARASDIAHQMVDDRNDTYPSNTVLKIVPEHSAHEWIGSHTRISTTQIRDEFYPSASSIADRLAQSWFLGKHIFDLFYEDEDLEYSSLYEVCTQCYLLKNKEVVCPNCI